MRSQDVLPKGRFAPSPTGRMHIGNIFTALISWLSVKSIGGKWVLRIEDLDTQRSKPEFVELIEEDLLWLGLDYDEGGISEKGSAAPYFQSKRAARYQEGIEKLCSKQLIYPCYCTRADLMSSLAPHESDGRVIYNGKCRPKNLNLYYHNLLAEKRHDNFFKENCALRIAVPDENILFYDGVSGETNINLARNCGDFIVRRKDGVASYQLAVVIDDADMGITQVVRGNDLLISAAQQLYLYELLGLSAPEFYHIPLICNENNIRLSKRDKSLGMETLRKRYTAEEIIGKLAHIAGLTQTLFPIKASELIQDFDWTKVRKEKFISVSSNF